MTREMYNSNTNDFINNANQSKDVTANAIADALKTNRNNESDLYVIVNNLQRENGVLKAILKEIVINESFNYIIEKQDLKNFLKID